MTAQAQALTRDEAQIRSNINSFSVMADQSAFEYLGRLFAPKVKVDYTSLFGGQVTTESNTELMKQWAAFLPGFDRTFHDLSNINVDINGSNAVVTADITASHWLGSHGFWSVSGEYVFKLTRSGDNWLINSIQIVRSGEKGSRDILAQAPKRAAENLAGTQSQRVAL